MVREPDPAGASRWSPQERTWGEYADATMLEGIGLLAGHALRANVYVETFTCEGSQPILQDGHAVAGTVHAAGSGRAFLLGTYAGHSGTAYRNQQTHDFLHALLAHCGVTPQRQGELLLRKRVAENKEAWLLTNATPLAVTSRIDVSSWHRVSDLLAGPMQADAHGHVSVMVPGLDVRVLIVER